MVSGAIWSHDSLAGRERSENFSRALWGFWSHHSAGSSQRNKVSVDRKAVLCVLIVCTMLLVSLAADLGRARLLVLGKTWQTSGTRTTCSSGAGTRVGNRVLSHSVTICSRDKGKFNHNHYTPASQSWVQNRIHYGINGTERGLSVPLLKCVCTTRLCGQNSAL